MVVDSKQQLTNPNKDPMIMPSFIIKAGLSLFAGIAITSCGVQNGSANAPVIAKQKAENVSKSGMPSPASAEVIAKTVMHKKDKHGMASYKDAERQRYVRTTAYSHMEMEPGAPGRKNAAGGILKYGNVRSAAADWSVYPLGTKFKIKGQPYTYVVDDYGSALAGTNTIDIFKPTLGQMRNWGTRKVEISVVQWGCYDRSCRLLKGRTGYRHCRNMYTAILRKLSSGNFAKVEDTPKNVL